MELEIMCVDFVKYGNGQTELKSVGKTANIWMQKLQFHHISVAWTGDTQVS
jgi:hypothetical protein